MVTKPVEDAADSFDALLRQAARVTGPRSSAAHPPLSIGATLSGGRLSVLRRVGEGGMGVVYEAFDTQRKARVALKTLSRLDARGIYQMKNEFRALADVTHPNLVRLHELFADGERWFFTMDLIDGERFDRWVRPDGLLHEARLRAALPQLLAAVEAIHAAGKLHRDLKPSNVLVAPDGRVLVLDFGLAVDPEPGGVGQTVLDEGVSGTPAYMAPEQAAGAPATTASDFYALGVMLFEALTGKLPFEGTVGEMLSAKQTQPAPRLHAPSTQVQTDLAALCDALLARDAAARPDAQALRSTLGAASTSHVAPSTPPTAAEREILFGRDAELAQLRAAYDATVSGQPVVVFLSGESGMGKTALVAHFLDELRAQGHAAVLAGRCYERESVPFKGIDSLIDDLSRLLRRLPHAEATALMPREVYALARVFPVLDRIYAVALAPKKDIVDPQELRMRACSALCGLLARIRDRQPLVLYIDDVQWLDRDAVTLLGYVLAHHEPPAMLLVFSHRSEGAADHALLNAVRQQVRDNARLQQRDLALGALPPAATRALAMQLLGAEQDALADELALESSGSPFLLRELSRQTLQSTGRARLTLHEAVLAHVQALAPAARELLEVVAVAGRPLDKQLALNASGARHEHVDTLLSERLLRASGGGQERCVECYHDKVRESVTVALAAERLRDAHARLLTVLGDQQDADAEHLAVHAEGAGDRAAAARYAAQAAAAASASMAFEQAAMLYARALELGEHADGARRELQTRLGDALANAGRGADAARAYLDAAVGADEEHTLELKHRAAEHLLVSGHIDDGKALLDEVLRVVGFALPRTPRAALISLAWERTRLGIRGLGFEERKDELPEREQRVLNALWSAARGLLTVDAFTGAALAGRYVRHALDSGVAQHAVRALCTEAYFVSAMAGPAAAPRSGALLDRAEAHALALRIPETIAVVHLDRGLTAIMQGDMVGCRPHLGRAIEMMRERRSGIGFALGAAMCALHLADVWSGGFAPAAEVAGMIEEAWRRGDIYEAVTLTGASVFGRLVQGDVEGVRRHLRQARQGWRRLHYYSMAEVVLLWGETWLANYTGAPGQALERLQADWPEMKEALLLHSPGMRAAVLDVRGSLALNVARLGGRGAGALRNLAQRDARAITRQGAPTSMPPSYLLRAGLAYDAGKIEQAVSLLRAGMNECDEKRALTFAAGMRRRLGQLLGGDEGAALVAQADAALLAMGAVDLEATTRLFTYGVEFR